MDEHEMKTKPVLPLLVSYALPMVVSMLVNSLYNIIDTFFIARLGADAVTALSLIFPLQNAIISVSVGFGIGVNAVISFCLGAGQKREANLAMTHGLAYSVLHTLVLTVAGLGIMPWFLDWFTSSTRVQSLAMTYGAIVFSFTFAVVIGVAFEKIFQAAGRMKQTMVSLACGCVANIVLDPLLIFGIGPFPAWGIAGAAVATGIGQVISLVIYLYLYVRYPLPVRVRRAYLRPDVTIDTKLYAIGIPATLNMVLPSILIASLNGLLAQFSQVYIVILGIYYKLQTFLYLPANGIIQGMRPLMGYNYGAGAMRRVRRIYQYTLVLVAAIMVLGTALAWWGAVPILSVFTQDLPSIHAGVTALHVISMGFIISALSVTTSGALEGLGQGRASLVITACRYVIIMLPLAYAGSWYAGPQGIWHSFWLTECLTAALSLGIMVKFFKKCGELV